MRRGQTGRVRIVLVVPGGVDPPGGSRVIPFLHDLVERLAADHHVRVIAVGHDPAPGSWRLFGAEVVNVPVGRHSRSDVARVVREVTALVGGGARGARPDVVHGWWATLPGLAATVAARRHRTPSVLSVAGGELAWLPDIGYGGGGSRGTRAMARTAIGLATTVTVATEWMRAHVLGAGGRVDEVVPLGADLRRWAIADGAPAGTDPLRLVHVGSANRVKDQTMLLHALDLARRDEPGLRLDLVGLDTLDGEHERLVERLGLGDHVRRHGLVAHDDVPALVRGAGAARGVVAPRGWSGRRARGRCPRGAHRRHERRPRRRPRGTRGTRGGRDRAGRRRWRGSARRRDRRDGARRTGPTSAG